MTTTFIHNQQQQQFELHVPDGIAFVEYFTEGKKLYLTHTEVPESARGKGIASELIGQTLDYLKRHHFTLVPQCAFVSAYVDQHPEWRSILSEGYQM